MDLRHRPDLSIRVVDGEVVVLDRKREKIHQLNSTASFVWNRLAGDVDLTEVARALARSYDVEESAALSDVRRIVEELRELGLLVSKGSREQTRESDDERA